MEPFRSRARTKPTSARRHGTNPKNTGQPLSKEEARKKRRLEREGIIILIDQPSLEKSMSDFLRRQMDHGSWSLSYGKLVDIIARKGEMSREQVRKLRRLRRDGYVKLTRLLKEGYHILSLERKGDLSKDQARGLGRLKRHGYDVLMNDPNLRKDIEEALWKGMRERIAKFYLALSPRQLLELLARKGRTWRDLRKVLGTYTVTDLITWKGRTSRDRRKVLGTYIVTSKQHQVKRRHRPSRQYLKRHNIELIRLPEANGRSYGKNKEIAANPGLVRIMTQEFEGIEIQRLNGISPPKRTFCLIGGDFYYADVLQKARECGCDVEVWFWDDIDSLSSRWSEQRQECSSERCGTLTTKKLAKFEKDLTRSWKKKHPAWSVSPYPSDLKGSH